MSKKKVKFRPRLTEDEYEVVQKYKSFKEASEEQGLNVEDVKHGWFKNKKNSLFATNPAFKGLEQKELENIRGAIVDIVRKEALPVKKRKSKGEHLLVIDPADVHIGKLASAYETGETYNIMIAEQRVLEGVEGILDNAKGWDIGQIMFVAGNDILHTDTPKLRTTTSGTPQDTDGMWYEAFLKAVELYKQVLERLMKVAPVHFVFNPSNHDYTNGFFLAQLIEAYFHKNKNITFDVSIAHRKYYHFGVNLIGTTHGDGAKIDNLNGLMAHEAPKMWAETKYRYFYTHHLHHKSGKDLIGVCVEALRSPSGTDSWHHINGYQGAIKAIEGYIHHKEYGQVARLSHLF